MTQFRYFLAPEAEVFGYSDKQPCIHCGQVAPATALKTDEPENPTEFCCLECLSAGRSLVEHETELGFAGESEFSQFDLASLEMVAVELPAAFSVESLSELSRTPDFKSHQGREYLVHCNDFMRYLGRWEPEDFADTIGESGRETYLAMADGDPQLWDETEKEKKEAGRRWPLYRESRWAFGSWCYVFECLHCGKRRCSWDCD
jgi:uncharacterized protein CbrC (UPF0167 family)